MPRPIRFSPTGSFALLTLLGACAAVSAAPGSGTDYLFAVPPNYYGDLPPGEDGAGVEVEVHLAAATAGEVSVEWPALAPVFTTSVWLVPGEVSRVTLPDEVARGWIGRDVVDDRAVRLSGPMPFQAWVADLVVESSDSALLQPTWALGRKHVLASFAQLVGDQGNFTVTAVEDDTHVLIRPRVDLRGDGVLHPAGRLIEVTLQAGEAYLAPAPAPRDDLTGTTVDADRPVAVLQGVTCANVPLEFLACDRLLDMARPSSTWGREFVLPAAPDRPTGSLFRVFTRERDTEIRVDGILIDRLRARQWIQVEPGGAPAFLHASAPVSVTQYITGYGTPGALTGDPAACTLPAISQYLPSQVFSTTVGDQFDEHHAVIVAADEDVGALQLDGVAVPGTEFVPVPGSGHSVASLPVAEGSHATQSSRPHAVLVVGYAVWDSYFHSAGHRLTSGSCVDLDSEPPVLEGLGEDLHVSCDEVPPPPVPTAIDNCEPGPTVEFSETREDGPCPDSYRLRREWTATDAAGLTTTELRFVDVEDVEAPSLHGVPADASASCDELPSPAPVSASDDCDPAPSVGFEERREEGACPDSYRLLRTWTGTDRCGNASSATQVLEVFDDQSPVLVGVPADAVVECDAVPAPASPVVEDACDPDPRLDFFELREDGPCPSRYTLRRTWTATDRCGNSASATQVLEVVDTQPPIVAASDELVACLWSPNHAPACLDRGLLDPVVRDACSEDVSWRLVGCLSSQPDDALGDGGFTEDCVVSPDGESACLRAERQGPDAAGRDYGLAIVATDACGNESEPVVVGRVHVPHDATGLRDCPRVLRARP